jgi:hypothetical protein
MTLPRDDDRIAHMIEACEQAAEFVEALDTRAVVGGAASRGANCRHRVKTDPLSPVEN